MSSLLTSKPLASETVRPSLRINFFRRADFLAGQYFDIRLEVHAPLNGSEAIGLPADEHFTFTVAKGDDEPVPVTEFFSLEEPKLERWDFSWFEGAFFNLR